MAIADYCSSMRKFCSFRSLYVAYLIVCVCVFMYNMFEAVPWSNFIPVCIVLSMQEINMLTTRKYY